jgi:hypothetical protein
MLVVFRPLASLVVALAAVATCASALADEAPPPEARAANDLLDLFSQVCMKNLGKPEGVQAWAADHHLVSVENPEALKIYAGGEGGAVWAVHMPTGQFVLAIRAPSHACSVFADKADPQVVEGYIDQLMRALKQTGRPVEVLKDDRRPTSVGSRHARVYAVGGSSGATLMLYAVITDERPGGPYQATVQVAAAARTELQAPEAEAPSRP